ncbi:hypothetical protein ANO14919_077840 [Xylariales sp. No.14919]|nr:hypothetical protein ANO14919_077840 [Xylariales sp. No.14919]
MKPTNAETATKLTSVLGDDRLHEDDDASTIGDAEIEANMNTPTIDKTNLSCGHFLIDSNDSSTVLEGWEIISVQPTTELTSSKRIFGVNVVSTYKVMKDGYTGVRAIPSYSQLELAHTVATAEREWASQKSSRLVRHNTYSQDLARRIFELPACLPSKLGALLDCRFVATNKNPHVRREWKIIMLKPVLEVLTDEGQPPRNLGIWNKGGGRQNTPVQKWLVILRGQDTRVSQRCFQTFSTMSNPWLKVDERLHSDGEHVTEQHERPDERQ